MYYCEKCGSKTHRDDAMNSRCNSCEHLVRQCICESQKENAMETIIYGYDTDSQRNLLDRIIRIEEKDGTKYEMPFPSKEVTDSKALHHLLSFVDPGDEYTVVFGKKEN